MRLPQLFMVPVPIMVWFWWQPRKGWKAEHRLLTSSKAVWTLRVKDINIWMPVTICIINVWDGSVPMAVQVWRTRKVLELTPEWIWLSWQRPTSIYWMKDGNLWRTLQILIKLWFLEIMPVNCMTWLSVMPRLPKIIIWICREVMTKEHFLHLWDTIQKMVRLFPPIISVWMELSTARINCYLFWQWMPVAVFHGPRCPIYGLTIWKALGMEKRESMSCSIVLWVCFPLGTRGMRMEVLLPDGVIRMVILIIGKISWLVLRRTVRLRLILVLL